MKIADFKATTERLLALGQNVAKNCSSSFYQNSINNSINKEVELQEDIEVPDGMAEEEIATFADETGVIEEGIESKSVPKAKTRKLTTTKEEEEVPRRVTFPEVARALDVIRRYLEEDGGRI